MEQKTLTLSDAIRLARILEKYTDGKKSGVDFIASIIDDISPSDYAECIRITSRETDLKESEYISYLTNFIQALNEHNIITLVNTLKSVGLV